MSAASHSQVRAAVREARDQDQRRARNRPRQQPEDGTQQVTVSAAGEGIKRRVHRADDEESSAKDHALVVEHVRHHERRNEHRDQRDEQRGAEDALLGVDDVRQPGIGRPRPPERGQYEHPAPDPGERGVVGEQRCDLREREHEDEVEEELLRRDAVLTIDCRDGHRPRPYSASPKTNTGKASIRTAAVELVDQDQRNPVGLRGRESTPGTSLPCSSVRRCRRLHE
jgi:hypothetical protein